MQADTIDQTRNETIQCYIRIGIIAVVFLAIYSLEPFPLSANIIRAASFVLLYLVVITGIGARLKKAALKRQPFL